ncbi:MAG: PilZ domain-containing protein [Candidatus Electrothrix sp. AR4]|nr:PilZ domain-containing protein [Candidatus Electrothrix sp. AR4]
MIERRRFNRVSSNVRVSVTLCDTYKLKIPLDTPATGKITDFSPHGVCLLLDKIQYGGHHIFDTTQYHEDHIIRLEYITDDENNSLIIYGNSTWYDRYSGATDSARFKLGIEFLVDQDQDILQKFLAKLASRQSTKEGWLKKLFKQS